MSILNAIFFQLKCLFFGMSIEVENVADERAFKPAADSVFTTNDMIPHVGREFGLGRSDDLH